MALLSILLNLSNRTPPIFPRQVKAVESLGGRLRLARERRRMPAAEMAQRAGISRTTLHALEHGDFSVGLGVVVRVLGVLGLDGDLDLLARDDELGRLLQDARLPRPRRSVR